SSPDCVPRWRSESHRVPSLTERHAPKNADEEFLIRAPADHNECRAAPSCRESARRSASPRNQRVQRSGYFLLQLHAEFQCATLTCRDSVRFRDFRLDKKVRPACTNPSSNNQTDGRPEEICPVA